MLTRVITGLTLAPLVIWLIVAAPKPAMLVVLGLATARCVDELLRMFPEMRRFDRAVAALLATALSLSPLVGHEAILLVLGLVTVAWLGLALVHPGDVVTASRRAALGLLSITYIGATCASLVGLFHLSHQPTTAPVAFAGGLIGPFDLGRGGLLSVLVIVFLGDTGAYFMGRNLGRHKLYPSISPKKTVEGAVGGLIASILGGWLCQVALLPELPLSQALVLGAGCGAIGQVGDLAESMFKRATDTKDSGTLLPGHGGLLDRVDGVLFAAPVLYAWLLVGA